MRGSAIRILKAARHVPIIAASLIERTVQIWNWDAGECVCEFDTVADYPRLSVSPSGDYLVAANWRIGRLGGVACYSTRTGEKLWHRTDIRRTMSLRFASSGASIWCGVHGSSLQQLDAQTGDTLAAMRAVQEVQDSPYSDHRLVISRQRILIKGAKDIVVPRLTFAVLDAAFSPNALCITEACGVVRCIDLGLGLERWRYVPPQSDHLTFLWYSHFGRCFYGTRWPYEHGGQFMLIRLPEETGAFTEVCPLNSYPDCCCFGDGIVVASSGDVVSLENGNAIRRLEFPECDYPDRPAQTSDSQ